MIFIFLSGNTENQRGQVTGQGYTAKKNEDQILNTDLRPGEESPPSM